MDALEALRQDPEHGLIVSDVDGTLARITRLANETQADPAAVAALAAVAEHVGRTALLTGRPAEVAAGLGDFWSVRNLVVLGHYGLDRWQKGVVTEPPADPGVVRARARVPELPEGAYVEEKGLSFVVHTRPAADPAGALEALDGPLRRIASEEGLEVVDGSFARELRPPGIDKGSSILSLVAAAPTSAVIYLGDDDGDLPAAHALQSLRSSGTPGLVVCSAREGGSAELRALADVVVDGVDGVAAWLRELASTLSS